MQKNEFTLAQQLRPLLGPDFDQFDDEELEIVLTVIREDYEKNIRELIDRTTVITGLRVRV